MSGQNLEDRTISRKGLIGWVLATAGAALVLQGCPGKPGEGIYENLRRRPTSEEAAEGPSREVAPIEATERLGPERFYGEWDVTGYKEYMRYRVGGPISEEPKKGRRFYPSEIGLWKFFIEEESVRFRDGFGSQSYQTAIRRLNGRELILEVISSRGSFSQYYTGFTLRFLEDGELEIIREPNPHADDRTIYTARRHK